MKKVLYAEDEFTNRKLMDIQFKNHGIPCDLAQNGQEALDLFQQNTYSLILLDQYMPGYNGDELARIIRETHPQLPLIAITSDDSTVAGLKEAGFDKVFVKPLRGKEYMHIIEKFLENS